MEDLTPKCVAVSNYIIEKTNKFNEGKTLQERVMLTIKKSKNTLFL